MRQMQRLSRAHEPEIRSRRGARDAWQETADIESSLTQGRVLEGTMFAASPMSASSRALSRASASASASASLARAFAAALSARIDSASASSSVRASLSRAWMLSRSVARAAYGLQPR